MGYHVQIIRKQRGMPSPISRFEIEELARTTPGLRIEPSSLKAAEFDLVISRGDKDVSRLTLQNGELWTKNPEDDEIEAMLDLAEKLEARVRGDDFETYKNLSETFLHPDDVEEKEIAYKEGDKLSAAQRREQSRIRLFIILLFAILGIAAFYFGKMFE